MKRLGVFAVKYERLVIGCGALSLLSASAHAQLTQVFGLENQTQVFGHCLYDNTAINYFNDTNSVPFSGPLATSSDSASQPLIAIAGLSGETLSMSAQGQASQVVLSNTSTQTIYKTNIDERAAGSTSMSAGSGPTLWNVGAQAGSTTIAQFFSNNAVYVSLSGMAGGATAPWATDSVSIFNASTNQVVFQFAGVGKFNFTALLTPGSWDVVASVLSTAGASYRSFINPSLVNRQTTSETTLTMNAIFTAPQAVPEPPVWAVAGGLCVVLGRSRSRRPRSSTS
jgi:hypothetical protein